MAENKYLLLEDQLNEHQNELMELHTQVDAYRNQKVEGELMVQDLLTKKNEELVEKDSTIRVITD